MRKVSPEGLAAIRLVNFRNWLKVAATKHGERFDYDKVSADFETQKGPEVQFYCKQHKVWFHCTPHNHIRFKGGGCSLCSSHQKSENKHKAAEARWNKWNDELRPEHLIVLGKFEGMTKTVKVRCEIHQETKDVKPTLLLNNKNLGCMSCAHEATSKGRRLSFAKIKKLTGDLPENISFLASEYTKHLKRTHFKLSCEIHGDFQILPENLKRSFYVCQQCAKESVGYASHRLKKLLSSNEVGRPTNIAIMKIEAFGITSAKIGITRRPLEERYSHHLKAIYYAKKINEIDAIVLERRIKTKFRSKEDSRVLKTGMRNGKRWGGDTELFMLSAKKELVTSLKQEIKELASTKPDYQHELELLLADMPEEQYDKEKDLSNLPIPVLGIDPVTLNPKVSFDSLADAQKAGFHSLSSVLAEDTDRILAGGLRWIKKNEFEATGLKSLKMPKRRTRPVECIEKNLCFHSAKEAAEYFSTKGNKIDPNKIYMVVKGIRKKTGGFSWRTSLLTHSEIESFWQRQKSEQTA